MNDSPRYVRLYIPSSEVYVCEAKGEFISLCNSKERAKVFVNPDAKMIEKIGNTMAMFPPEPARVDVHPATFEEWVEQQAGKESS